MKLNDKNATELYLSNPLISNDDTLNIFNISKVDRSDFIAYCIGNSIIRFIKENNLGEDLKRVLK